MYGLAQAIAKLGVDGVGCPDRCGLAWPSPAWLAAPMGASVEFTSKPDRRFGEQTEDLRGLEQLRRDSLAGDSRFGGTGSGGSSPGIGEAIERLANRAFALARELSALAVEAGIADTDPFAITPRVPPRAPQRKVKR